MTESVMDTAVMRRPLHPTKIAVVLLDTLPTWQKLNATAFLASGIAATAEECIGSPYEDADGTPYTPMFGQPVLVFEADAARLSRTLDRAHRRGIVPAVFTAALFGTGNDEDNRAEVAARGRADLDLVGLAVRAERKTVDKIVDGLTLHR
ncbi:DUF2000 domain-containing protein [Mycolicibacterium chlorophenolicum]|uniref:DUF2000 domain-containing protein n=1 Tax=Mycolicibacterium chlorophenolicum TaxID=37916 RepID=A0A0J6ZEM0_9MYCO|nr:DUF2000 domain-containing protein [Mycolicibacterium chlorophenolicum]KMO83216.1 hypothetical protein MCHLDSM_00561 [Mycolicibacterium chlorophenolicum]